MGGTKKSITGFSEQELSTRKISLYGTFVHDGKSVVSGDASDLVDNGDVVGPVVIDKDLAFHYKDSTGVVRLGKTLIKGNTGSLVSNGDIAGPNVVGNDLVFYYKTSPADNSAGVNKTLTFTGV